MHKGQIKMSMNQYESMMATATDKLREYQDIISAIKTALRKNRTAANKVLEINEILKRL